jgi:sulfite exporter TauE/SafE
VHGHLTAAAPALAGAGLWAAFLLGLTGGFGHCLAMCGPFVAAASLAEGEGRTAGAKVPTPVWFQGSYHLGRLATYTLLGLLLGLLGQAGALAGLGSAFSPDVLTRWLKVAAGASLIVLGAVLLASALRRRGFRVPEPTALVANRAWFRRATAALARRPRWGFALGMLMGLLPCAPLLPVEIAALATGVPLYGAMTMLAFGIGTVPALAGLGVASGLVGTRARGWFSVATAGIVVALGIVVLWQGLAIVAGS